uniref:UEV domain-containing protein n=1 Tax=Neolamprologus brichardi TaxID=32507 RepID=A0A3Q4GYV4_NEOBR
MDLTPEQIQRILSKYKFRDVAVEELEKIYRIYPGMKPSTGTYTFSDSTQKDLLKLTGTLPVQYEGMADPNSSHLPPNFDRKSCII